MIMTCPICDRQIIVRERPLNQESRTSATECRCGTCGTIFTVSIGVLRETDLTPAELKARRNKTS